MTIVNETTKVTVLGNGAQTTFNYGFLIPRAGECALWYVDLDGVAVLIDPSDYTVNNIGNSAGGTFSYAPAIATGTSLTLVREVPYTQTAALSNQGAFYPQTLESGGLDRIVMQVQQLATEMTQTVRAPIVDGALNVLPTEENRNGWLYFGTDGQPVITAIAPPASPIAALEIDGDQSLFVQPTGNTIDTYSSFSVVATTIHPDTREFIANIGMVNEVGQAHHGVDNDGDKVALYVGSVAQGTEPGDHWAFNSVVTALPSTGTYNVFSSEIDHNNLNAHRGDTPGGGGYAAPVSYGVALTGVSGYRNTAGFAVVGPSGGWNRGFAVAGGAAVQASFQDVGTATRSLDMQGTHDIGLSLEQGVFSRAAIMLPVGLGSISAFDGSNDVDLMGLEGVNTLTIGNDQTDAYISADSFFAPRVDNAISCGAASERFSVVYAATGTINTSDETLKTDIRALEGEAMLRLVRAVDPVAYRWRSGGKVKEEYVEMELRPVYETVEFDAEETVVEDGVGHVRTVRKSQQRPVLDTVPVLDDAGRQLVDVTKPVRGKNGELLAGPRLAPRVQHVPRMAEQPVTKTRWVDRPGQRTHYGFLAQDVQRQVEKQQLGDFAGYVRMDDGTEGLRPDQLIPILWSAVQILDAEVHALKQART